MKCERCGNEADFLYNENINGKKSSMALCYDCALKAGLVAGGEGFSHPAFGAADLFGTLFGKKQESPAKSCPTCGMRFAELRAEGKVGCPDCYKTFGAELATTIRQMHGNTKHIGRAPATSREAAEKVARVSELRAALKSAVEAENFEEAARLRDEIRALGEA